MRKLPKNWSLRPLGTLAKYINGYSFKPTDWDQKGLPIIRIQNLSSEDAPFNYFSGDLPHKFRVRNGDLLISWSATLDVFFWYRGDAWLNQHIFRVEENSSLATKKFLSIAVKHALDDIRAKAHGLGMVHIKRKPFEETLVTLPPIDEQNRIVARIEELTSRAEEVRRLRQDTVTQIATQFFHVRKIYQSLLSESPTKPLGKCGIVIGGGTPSKNRDDYWHGDVPWVAPKEMKTFRITASSEQITETAISESSAKLIPAGSVLFVVRGMILARYVPVAVSDVPCAINQDMKAIVPDENILADYLAHMLWGANDILQGMVETAGHGTKKLETPAWSRLEIPVPNIRNQQAVVDELKCFQKKMSELESLQTETAKEIEQFQSALLAKAFRGEL